MRWKTLRHADRDDEEAHPAKRCVCLTTLWPSLLTDTKCGSTASGGSKAPPCRRRAFSRLLRSRGPCFTGTITISGPGGTWRPEGTTPCGRRRSSVPAASAYGCWSMSTSGNASPPSWFSRSCWLSSPLISCLRLPLPGEFCWNFVEV